MRQLAGAFEELGMAPDVATSRARLTYSAYLGFLQLYRQDQTPLLSSDEMSGYMEHVIDALIPA